MCKLGRIIATYAEKQGIPIIYEDGTFVCCTLTTPAHEHPKDQQLIIVERVFHYRETIMVSQIINTIFRAKGEISGNIKAREDTTLYLSDPEFFPKFIRLLQCA